MALYKVGFVAGNFDLIHPGYIKLFRYTKKYCNHLIVAVHEDPTLEGKKKFKPVHTFKERKMILGSIRFVDQIVKYRTEDDLFKLLRKLPISVRFLDEQYKKKNIIFFKLKIKIKWVPRKHSYSKTKLIKKIKLL